MPTDEPRDFDLKVRVTFLPDNEITVRTVALGGGRGGVLILAHPASKDGEGHLEITAADCDKGDLISLLRGLADVIESGELHAD